MSDGFLPDPFRSDKLVSDYVGAAGEVLGVMTESRKATYSASATGFLPVATPTDIFNIFGSATKTVRITKLELWAVSTSISAELVLALAKRSTVGTIGSAVLTGLTAVPHDSADGAATAVASTVGTANYTTVGTIVGYVSIRRLVQLDVDTPAGLFGGSLLWDWTNRNEKAIVLRGVAEQLAINYQGAAVPSGTLMEINITWTEEPPDT